MKKTLILLLLLTATAGAQVTPPFAFWKSGAAPSFSPADIDSLKGWYVAADLADSLGKSAGDTTYIFPNRAKYLAPYASGDLFQLTSASKPLLRDSTFGKMVEFDGVNDFMRQSLTTYEQPNTVFLVAKLYKWNNAFNVIYDGSNTTNRNEIWTNTTGVLRMLSTSDVSTGLPISEDTLYIFNSLYSGASSYTEMNGNRSAAVNSGISNWYGMVLGAANTGSVGFVSLSVCELIVYSSALTETQIDDVQSYLATKYGITLP